MARKADTPEDEWLACADPPSLLSCLVRKFDDISRRKMRLFGCACCRRIWHFLRDQHSRQAVEAAEYFADEEISRKELAAARAAALLVVGSNTRGAEGT